MRDRYDFDNAGLEDENWGTAIQLTPIHHDMIATDTLEDYRFRSDGGGSHNNNNNNNNNITNDNNNNHRHQRRRSSAQLWGKSYSNSPWDPYYNRCLAKMMHWLLTKLCRLKPLPFNESSSTLSYESYAMASNNSLPIIITENHTQQQQQQRQLSIDGDDDGERKVTNATRDINKHSKNKVDVEKERNGNKGGKNRKGDNDTKYEKDRQGKDGIPVDSLPIHPTANSTSQHLMIPDKTSTNATRRSSSSSPSPSPPPAASAAKSMSLSSSSSPDYTDGTPTSAIRSSDEEDKSFSSGRRGTLSSSPLSSLRLARRSRKFRAAILHHRRENSNPPEQSTTPTAFSATPSPSSSAAARTASSLSPIPGGLSPPSSKPSSLHLSQTSSLHLPDISSPASEIDRLSLLSSIESGASSTKSFEPLTAPPHHYYHGRQRRRRRRQQHRHRLRKHGSHDSSALPSLSITLADENEHQGQDDQVPLSTPTSSSSSSSTSDEESSGTGSPSRRALPRHTIPKRPTHGVKLHPSVLQDLLLDWELPTQPLNETTPHAHVVLDQAPMDDAPLSNGLEGGWTHIIHIGQAWDVAQDTTTTTTTTNLLDSSSSSNSSISSDGDNDSFSASYRVVCFVEHWFKDYLGSRWFVV
ncbi:hypothetical protein BCR42DRAFT_420973, partial [Absidia repens]